MKRLLLFIALLCAVAQGAWAQWNGQTREQPPLVSSNTIRIQNEAQLAYVCDHWLDEVNEDYRYNEISYELDADLDLSAVSWVALGRANLTPFNGTFWGRGHTIKIRIEGGDSFYRGLFAKIGETGVVRNLHVTGTISVGDARLVGGIAGYNVGTIENCWVSADISSTHYHSVEDADLGGIAGENAKVIRYCSMTGNVTNTGGNSGVGGIAGCNNGRSINNGGIWHCTFYGSVSVNHSQANKYVGAENGKEENMYDAFNQSEYSDANGWGYYMYCHAIKCPHTVSINTVGPGSIPTQTWDDYDYTLQGTYPGATYTLNVTSGTVACITITDADGDNVSVSGNQVSGYTFTMPNKDVTANVVFYENWPTQGNGTEGTPYLISSSDDWNKFAHNVTYGRSYSGEYIKLTDDISVTKSAGSCNAANDIDYKPFSGTFDGDGHTLTINLSNQSRFGAPFKCVEGATINNLRTAGTIDGTGNENGKLLSGLVGVSFGNTTITDCVSSVTLSTNFGAQGYIDAALAGFVAGTVGGSLTVSGCVFDGAMMGAGNQRCAGISGYEYSDVGQGPTTTTISNTLFIPTTLTVSTTDDGYTKTITRDPDATITNCYYTQVLGTAQGTEASTPTSDPGNLGSLVQDYGMLKAYENGIFFNGKYCVAPTDATVIQPEDEFDAVCWQTHTTLTDWTPLSAGSTTGHTIGSADATAYYYITENLNFSNSTAGGSGLSVLGTVYLYIPYGMTLTSTGANANGRTGAGAGVELAAGNTLYLIGSGTLNATGGNAANGGNGGNGSGASGSYDAEEVYPGNGGAGGYGGGGAGAGIGTRGGNGGAGGSGGVTGTVAYPTDVNGDPGDSGSAGATADAMGNIYVYRVYQQTAAVTVNATGGSKATVNGHGGSAGGHFLLDFAANQTAAGGAGGGGGGYGGAASNIGTGGPGGGGGGGGSGGSARYKNNPGYYRVGSTGGGTGMDADGSWHTEDFGASTEMTGTQHFNDDDFSDHGYDNGSGAPAYADGGASGNASSGGAAQRVWGSLVLGSGTEADPYQIRSAADFDQLASNVNGGTTYENTFFMLVNDISVSNMVGTDDANSFQGTFDGGSNTLTFNNGTAESPFSENYCAPFRHVKNAVIKNLHVDGTIYTSVQKAAGFVGESHGALTITGCRSSVNINSSKSGDGTHGGFVATLSGSENDITFDGCVFDGSFATTNGTTNCGGFVGWGVYNKPVVSNSLMKPGSVDAGMLINTFARWYTGDEGIYEPTITNCYYVETTNLPTNQGTKAYAFTTATANLGSLTADYDIVKAYENGILYDGTYYVASTGSISLTVEGYGDGNDKWTFIASPVAGSIEPDDVTNLIGSEISSGVYDFDLYRLNPTSVMWENYNNPTHHDGFELVNGNGYLYAAKEDKTLVFSGTFNMDDTKTIGNLQQGFNLVGNPLIAEAYADRSYYKMNAEGTDIEVVENYAANAVPVCTGIVVRAENDGESITFSTTAPQQQSANNNGNLQMILTKAGVRNDALQDKAIVSFNEGSKLEKFIFNENHAKLYIPQYGEDYAIAFSEMTGEVPLNFRATETGRYTIGFNSENVKGVRIQLIDKLEDNTIDLNKDVSGNVSTYTFMGSTVDRSDRFTLVFTQVETDGIFAYQSGNDIIVSGEGELQVFDVMGRMVMNQQVNGVQRVEKPEQTGVYIFRLNGKTQKIVVR